MADNYNRYIKKAFDLAVGAQAYMGESGRDLGAAEKMLNGAVRIIRACADHQRASDALADAAEELSRAQGEATSLK